MKVTAAYAAGYIDADGCIGLTKQMMRYGKYHHNGYVSARSTSKRVLIRLSNTYGGNVNEIISQYRLWQKYRPVWDWHLGQTDQILSLLNEIEPFLILKKKQAHILIEFLQMRNTFNRWTNPITDEERQRRYRLYQEIKRLNHVGVPLEQGAA